MSLDSIRDAIAQLGEEANPLFDRDFLLTWELSDAAIRDTVRGAAILRSIHEAGLSTTLFDSGLGVSIFRDKSTRTRYSFRSGCNLLGLVTEELEESTSQIGHGETVRETATMISFLTEVIGIRDDMFLGQGHTYMQEVATSVEESRREGVLGHRPAVINLQCDLDHPTQSLSDLRHLEASFGSLENLRDKKLALTWAYSPSYGKPLSVPQGIAGLMTRFGLHVTLAHPPGYELVDEPLEAASRFASASGGSFTVTDSMDEAFDGSDIVYPKSWAPLHVMRRRTELRGAGDAAGLKELEREALAHNAKFKEWECTEDRMRRTKDGRALYMHCLPADISGVSCSEGEVAAPVFERYRLATYREASHKPFVIAAMILMTRFANPDTVLEELLAARAPVRP